MQGTVISVNRQKSLIAIDVEGEVTIVELLGDYTIMLNDVLSGELKKLGADEIFNITQNEEMDVYIQDTNCSNFSIKSIIEY